MRPEASDTGKWTSDLTTTALLSLLFFGWGHKHPQLRLLCEDSNPLAAGVDLFKEWAGKDQGTTTTDGNLVSPVEFGSSKTHPSI